MRYYISPINQRPHWALAATPRRSHWMEERSETLSVPMDIIEKEDSFHLSVLVPGLKAEDVSISLEKEILTIQGNLGYQREENQNYVVAERPSGDFKRSVKLQAAINAEKIEAKLTNGVLTVDIPKSEAAKPRTIKVN
jgi:HSP20 family protein